METFDTNVVVRLTVQDDEDQCRRAELAWRQAIERGGVFLPTVVLVELSWVLRVAYKMERSTIADVLDRITRSEGVTVENDQVIASSIAAYKVGDADFADYVIVDSARRASALPLYTFDKKLAHSADVEPIP